MDTLKNAWKGWILRMHHTVFWDGDGILPYAKWLDRGFDYVELADVLDNKTEDGYKANWLTQSASGEVRPSSALFYPNPKVLRFIDENKVEVSVLGSTFILEKGGPSHGVMDGDCGGAEKTNDYTMALIAPGEKLRPDPIKED